MHNGFSCLFFPDFLHGKHLVLVNCHQVWEVIVDELRLFLCTASLKSLDSLFRKTQGTASEPP